MAKVGIVMGSDSDMPVMAKAADILEKLGIDYEMTIISAHREPDVFSSMQRAQRRRALRSLSQARAWRRIFRECARRSSRCRSSVSRCTPRPSADATPCTPSYRCRPAFRLPQWRSTAVQMQDYLQQRFWQHQMMQFCKIKRIFQRIKRAGAGEGCQTAGSGISELLGTGTDDFAKVARVALDRQQTSI